MLDSTLTELAAGLRAKRFSAVELARAHLERIDKLNGELNAFLCFDDALALESAARADARIATGESGPLTGIPIAHKDLFVTRRLPTT